MEFSISKSLEILERTPHVLHALLYNINDQWSNNDEGLETWSSYNVIGHLVYCEKADWMNKIEIIISDEKDKNFKPFDSLTQFQENKNKKASVLLDEFKSLRNANIKKMKSIENIQESLNKSGVHPVLGEVKLSQVIAAWVAHDLAHLSQISRIMAKQYKDAVGPWVLYLKILQN